MIDFQLYLITDRKQTAGRQLPAVVATAVAAGVTAVQLREKDLTSSQLFDLARELRVITAAHNARLLINDRIDIALAVRADGVHLGAGSMPVTEARRLLGSEMLIGYSAHSVAEAQQAATDGADFVTFGPVFPTPSKATYGEPLGLEKLAGAASALSIPVFALGGVKKTTINTTLSTGAHGIALISAIIAADDPAAETASILATIESHERTAR